MGKPQGEIPAVRVHLVIHGRVQGVFFRQHTLEQARSLGVTGWVRNRRDGTVEVVAEGKEDKVKKLVQWCHQGPPSALVTLVEEDWQAYQGEFHRFETTW